MLYLAFLVLMIDLNYGNTAKVRLTLLVKKKYQFLFAKKVKMKRFLRLKIQYILLFIVAFVSAFSFSNIDSLFVCHIPLSIANNLVNKQKRKIIPNT
jgi:hypothetical protein